MNYQYHVEKMVYQSQLVLLLKLIHHKYYPLTWDQMPRLQLNQQWFHFWDTRHKIIQVLPDLTVILQHTMYHILKSLS